jgi:type IV pilus assembly protein PilY1
VQTTGTSPAACGQYLGNTYGTPEIRRFHSGDWGAIFGNGIGSTNGTAGIFIMLISHTNGAISFYYLPTGSSTPGNGIVEAGSLDVDLDHVIDYIYAGDLQGNVWRWDVTSSSPTTWISTTPFKLFTTPGGATQPITTRVVPGTLKTVSSVVTLSGQVLSSGPERVIVNFGTGQMTPLTTTTPTTYASGQQYLFGIWDWNMGVVPSTSSSGSAVPGSGWNGGPGGTTAPAQLAITQTGSGPGTINSLTSLQVQTITTNTPTATQVAAGYVATRTVTKNAVCYDTSTGCTQQYGWYIALPGASEQIIFDPVISPEGELVVNTLIPVTDSPLTCSPATATGFSMGLAPDTGGESPTPYFTVFGNANAQVDGVQLNGTGTPSFLSSGMKGDNNSDYLLTQTGNGAASPQKINRHAIVNGQRLNWIQRR